MCRNVERRVWSSCFVLCTISAARSWTNWTSFSSGFRCGYARKITSKQWDRYTVYLLDYLRVLWSSTGERSRVAVVTWYKRPVDISLGKTNCSDFFHAVLTCHGYLWKLSMHFELLLN